MKNVASSKDKNTKNERVLLLNPKCKLTNQEP